MSTYEATWYINAKPIMELMPYSAYDVSHDRWVVHPDAGLVPEPDPGCDHQIARDAARATSITDRFDAAWDQIQGVVNPGGRLNAEITLRASAREGAALFEEIHEGRKSAYSSEGQGYTDHAEHRYKGAKATGTLAALRQLKGLLDASADDEETEMYGRPLTTARDTLVAAAVRRYRA